MPLYLHKESCAALHRPQPPHHILQVFKTTAPSTVRSSLYCIHAAKSCRGSIAGYTVNTTSRFWTSSAFTWENVGPGKNYTIVKVGPYLLLFLLIACLPCSCTRRYAHTLQFTPLALDPVSAQGTELCATLTGTCNTMEKLSVTGTSIEFALYDK